MSEIITIIENTLAKKSDSSRETLLINSIAHLKEAGYNKPVDYVQQILNKDKE